MVPGQPVRFWVGSHVAFEVDIVSFLDVIWVQAGPHLQRNYRKVCKQIKENELNFKQIEARTKQQRVNGIETDRMAIVRGLLIAKPLQLILLTFLIKLTHVDVSMLTWQKWVWDVEIVSHSMLATSNVGQVSGWVCFTSPSVFRPTFITPDHWRASLGAKALLLCSTHPKILENAKTGVVRKTEPPFTCARTGWGLFLRRVVPLNLAHTPRFARVVAIHSHFYVISEAFGSDRFSFRNCYTFSPWNTVGIPQRIIRFLGPSRWSCLLFTARLKKC